MRDVVVVKGQSLIDICTQELGGIDRIMEVCDLNDISLDAAIEPGTIIRIPDVKGFELDVASKIGLAGNYVNTMPLVDLPDDDILDGIDFMAIEDNFIIR
jgi:hypothetical protein